MKRMTTRHQWPALMGLALMAAQAGAVEEGVPNASVISSDQARLGYALGMDLGAQLRRQAVEVDPGVFARALSDGLAGGPTLMTPDEVRAEIGKLQMQIMRRQAEARAGPARRALHPALPLHSPGRRPRGCRDRAQIGTYR